MEQDAATGKATRTTNVPRRSIQEGMQNPEQGSPGETN